MMLLKKIIKVKIIDKKVLCWRYKTMQDIEEYCKLNESLIVRLKELGDSL